MYTHIYPFKDNNKLYLRTEFGMFEINNLIYNSILEENKNIRYSDLFIKLFEYKLTITDFYFDTAKEYFINVSSDYSFFKKNNDAYIYYFNKFKLYEDADMMNSLLYNVYTTNKYSKNIEDIFHKMSYNIFLSVLRSNLLPYCSLGTISLLISLSPTSYTEKEDVLEILAHTKYSFSKLGLFKKRNVVIDRSLIKNMFSFIKTLPKEEIQIYIKKDENPLFIDIISEYINTNYFNDFSFAHLFLPFKMTLRDKVPFYIRLQLIDEIGKRYYGLCYEIFEKDFNLLSKENVLKLLSYCGNENINVFMDKLSDCNHPIMNDKNIMFELLKKGYNILPYIDFDNLSIDEINLLQEHYKIELNNDVKKVKIHPKIKNKYKFEYELDEVLPNGQVKDNFLGSVLESSTEKFLFEFLISSNDIEIIYDNYYEQYKNLMIKKYGEEKFSKLDNIYHFLKFILIEKKTNNELVMPNLERIYKNLNLTNLQVEHIRNLMCTIDSSYSEKIDRFLMRQRTLALSKYNTIVKMHLNGNNISNILEEAGLNKEELISQILKMRNLYKEEKRALINLLKKEKYILTIGDILGLLQEMEENDYTIDEALRLNGINKKYFYTIYKELIYTNKELHNKIKESLLNNKKRGFKKYIRLAYYITSLEFNDEEEFKNMFPKINLDEMIKSMEKLGKINLVKNLQVIKQTIKSKIKQIN